MDLPNRFELRMVLMVLPITNLPLGPQNSCHPDLIFVKRFPFMILACLILSNLRSLSG